MGFCLLPYLEKLRKYLCMKARLCEEMRFLKDN